MAVPGFFPQLALADRTTAHAKLPGDGSLGPAAFNTLILLTSGATLTWAHWGLLQERRRQLQAGLLCTFSLGGLFLLLQAIEYHHAWTAWQLTLSAGAYGMTFYLLTGLHGLRAAGQPDLAGGMAAGTTRTF
jgi:cytochrome c oxidase subunit 3